MSNRRSSSASLSIWSASPLHRVVEVDQPVADVTDFLQMLELCLITLNLHGHVPRNYLLRGTLNFCHDYPFLIALAISSKTNSQS